MPAREPRYVIAEVTEEARDGWRNFCALHGTTPTALAEVIGLRLAELGDRVPPAVLERWVREARKLASERRRRD